MTEMTSHASVKVLAHLNINFKGFPFDAGRVEMFVSSLSELDCNGPETIGSEGGGKGGNGWHGRGTSVESHRGEIHHMLARGSTSV